MCRPLVDTVVDPAREAIGRQPLDHRLRIQERAVDSLGRCSQHPVELNSVWHQLLSGLASGISGHLTHELSDFWQWLGPGEIRLRDDAFAAAAFIDDRNPADLVPLHG